MISTVRKAVGITAQDFRMKKAQRLQWGAVHWCGSKYRAILF